MTALAKAGEITKKQASAIYDTLLSIAYAGAKDPKGIMLPGLGKLIKVKRPARKGRNPATGEAIRPGKDGRQVPSGESRQRCCAHQISDGSALFILKVPCASAAPFLFLLCGFIPRL